MIKMHHEEAHGLYYNCKSALATLESQARVYVLPQPINVTIESESLTRLPWFGF
jgi:hypothetical protein